MRRALLVVGALLALAPAAGAAPRLLSNHRAFTEAQRFNDAPSTRTVHPVAVYKTVGSVSTPVGVLHHRITTLSGSGAEVIYDFGKDVGGLVTLHFSGGSGTLGMAYAESSQFAGPDSDASTGRSSGGDGFISIPVNGRGGYTVPKPLLRGGFRYLTLFMVSGGTVSLSAVTLDFTADPDIGADPNAYPDYFLSSDALLNRIWYAGAYTDELDIIGPDQARAANAPKTLWDDSATVAEPGAVLVDGAKRDRTIWPGDMLMSVPSDAVSLDDMSAARLSLDALYRAQDSLGAFPYAGPPVGPTSAPSIGGSSEGSDAYHLDTMIVTYDYYEDTGNTAWLTSIWPRYLKGLNYALDYIDPVTGMFFDLGPFDWARADQGGENIEINALMYHVLTTCETLAGVEDDPSLASECAARAARLKAGVNGVLWDGVVGAYKDDPTGSLTPPKLLIPQDGNSLAIWYGLTDDGTQDTQILDQLRGNWTSIGARTPEFDNGQGIHPFPGGMEVNARFVAGDGVDALTLIRTEWGYMLNSPLGTRSTFWEGYHVDGNMADYYGSLYPVSYTSLAHAWSTGPVIALSQFVVGIADTSAGGASVSVIPQPSGLSYAYGKQVTPHGAVYVGWRSARSGFALRVNTPPGVALSRVGVPLLGAARTISLNGRVVWRGGAFLAGHGAAAASEATGSSQSGSYVYFTGVASGTDLFTWS